MGISRRALTPKKMILLALVSLVLLAAGGVAVWLLTRNKDAGDIKLNITPPPSLSELAEKYPQYAEILQDPELDSAYKDFLVAYQEGGMAEALELAKQRGLLTKNNELHVVLELKTDDSSAVEKELTEKGFRIGSANGSLVDVFIPLAVLEEALKSEHPEALFSDITSLEQVKRVRIPHPATIDELPAKGEGSDAIGAGHWHAQGITGKGVKVGILDLGFKNFTSYLGSALPEKVAGRSFVMDTALEDTFTTHGTVCAEIIHEVAPDAELYLAAYSTEAEMLDAVDWLIAEGVQVISNSTGSAYGPLDGTGIHIQAVERATSQGILWVNSAGNFGESHYRGTFVDTDGNGYHEFASGDELMGIQPVGGAAIILNWDDWGVGSEDYSLLLVDQDMDVLAASQNPQNGGGADAAEMIGYDFGEGGEVYYIAIHAENVSRPALFDFFLPNAAIEYPVSSYSVATPGDADGSLTVGAVYWENSALEPYSSQGPTHDERNKPDISAPAGAPSDVFGGPFSGTSASAPFTAGAGALVLQANPGFTGPQARAFLLERAVDLGNPGVDPQTGSGSLWLGTPPGAEAESEPTPPSRAGGKVPAPTARVVRGDRPDAGSSSTLQTVGLLCAFGAGAVGLFGIVIVLIFLFANWSSRRPAMARVPAAPAGPGTPGWQTPRQYGNVPGPQQQGPQGPQQQRPYMPGGQPPLPPAGAPMPLCANCGKPHRPGAKFCASCGATLPPQQVFCRFCGRPVRPQSRFCPGCGKPNP